MEDLIIFVSAIIALLLMHIPEKQKGKEAR